MGNESKRAFQDARRLCKYNIRLQSDMKKACRGQVLYEEGTRIQEETGRDRYRKVGKAETIVSAGGPLEAAGKYAGKKVCVLHFASPMEPHGYNRFSWPGSQEEKLCQCSTLYEALSSPKARAFYNVHREKETVLWTDDCLYTPGVTVFQEDTDGMKLLPEEEWYPIDVISCTPPQTQAREYKWLIDEAISAILIKRLCRVLEIAKLHGNDVVILGGFGCDYIEDFYEGYAENSFRAASGNVLESAAGLCGSLMERFLMWCRLAPVEEDAWEESGETDRTGRSEEGDQEKAEKSLSYELTTTVSPRLAARAARDVIREYRHDFDTIEFAMNCPEEDTMSYEIFADVLCPRRELRRLNTCRGISWTKEGTDAYPRHGICAHYNPAVLRDDRKDEKSNSIIRRTVKRKGTRPAHSCVADSMYCEACGMRIGAGQKKKLEQIVAYLNQGGDDAERLSALFYGVAAGEIYQTSPLEAQVKEVWLPRAFVPPKNRYQ